MRWLEVVVRSLFGCTALVLALSQPAPEWLLAEGALLYAALGPDSDPAAPTWRGELACGALRLFRPLLHIYEWFPWLMRTLLRTLLCSLGL
ncbi:MAG: hypothetical protein AB1758_34460 [Candidatus Eremiobacterota bacterium]